MKYLGFCIFIWFVSSLISTGCFDPDSNGELDTRNPLPLGADETPMVHEQEFIIADSSDEKFSVANAMLVADYESGWAVVNSGATTNIIFNNGFLPRTVSVWAGMYDCNGYWAARYTNVPPAHTAWDDMYTNGENVYWVDSERIIVHHEGVIRGSNIHDGCAYQRFKVYAWR